MMVVYLPPLLGLGAGGMGPSADVVEKRTTRFGLKVCVVLEG